MEKVNGLTIVVIMLSIAIIAAVSNQFFVENINADYLYGFETASNLLSNKSIAGQNFPIAPYYFPDLVVLMGLALVTSNVAILHYLYSLLFLTAYYFLVYELFRASGIQQRLAVFGALLALISYFCILPNHLTFLRDWPVSHHSVILVSLFYLQYYLKNRTTYLNKWVVFSGIFLCFISDKLLFVQFMAPFSMILLKDLFYKQVNSKIVYLMCGTFLIVFAIGAFANDFMAHWFSSSYSFDISLYRIRKWILLGDTFNQAMQLARESFVANAAFYIILFIYDVIGLMATIYLFVENKKNDLNLRSALLFLLLAQIFNVILALLSGKLTDADASHFRYLETIYFYPPIIMSLLLMHYMTRFRGNIIAAFVIIGVSGALFVNNNQALLQHFNLHQPYVDEVRCVDQLKNQYPITNGLATYWHVRMIRMLSKTGVMISQVDNDFNLTNRIDNKLYFYADSKQSIPLRYQFVVVDDLPKDKILQMAGQPDKKVYCHQLEFWLYYAALSQQRLNNAMAPQFAKLV